jgi:hypothetical protein
MLKPLVCPELSWQMNINDFGRIFFPQSLQMDHNVMVAGKLEIYKLKLSVQ